jgi:hypothetical protein
LKPYTFTTITFGPKQWFFRRAWGGVCLVFLLLAPQAFGSPYQVDSGNPRKLTAQETWIIGQIKQGKEADLNKVVSGKGNHSLNASFLKYLITDLCKNIKICNQGIKIANATIDGDLNLDNLEISYPLVLKHCKFTGDVTLKRSYFKKDLSFEGSQFLKNTNFTGIKIDGYCLGNDARFEGESLWNNAKIGLEFQARRAEFANREALVDFNSLKAGDSIYFEGAKFYGPVIFIRASTGRQFIAHESKYYNPEKLVNFGGIITGDTLYLIDAEFHGPVNFKLAEIGMNLNATGAKFLNENKSNNFNSVRVAQKVMLDKTYLRGSFDFSYSASYDFEISGAQKDVKKGGEKDVALSTLNLKGAQVQRNLLLANASLDSLNATQMKVKGAASFDNVQVIKFADFRGGNFQGINFEKVQWPSVTQQPQQDPHKSKKKSYRYEVYLGDITFGSISIDKPECDADANPCDSDYNYTDFKKIVDLLGSFPFYTQSYVQVENFFKHLGRDSWANAVFMSMHDRELAEKKKWYDPLRWLEWFFWGRIAGYGRAPFRVFFLALAFIILGAILFDPAYLIENKRPPKGNIYHSVAIRLILSLDRFLPIELGLAKYWESGETNFLTWFYFYLQQMIGWILIPIALASIYSQLK